MADIRRILVENTITKEYEINVEDWFDEFLNDWLSFKEDIDHGETVDQLKEEWIKEIAYDLACENSLEHCIHEDEEIEVEIWKQ